MIDFLNNGGSLYIEGVDIAIDLTGTNLLEYLGIELENEGSSYEATGLSGEGNDFFSSLNYVYDGGRNPHYLIDRISPTTGELMFSSDDGYGRMIINKTSNYISVASSIVVGAMANGDLLNHKAYLFSDMIDYFLDFQTSIEDAETEETSFLLGNYPNPFSKTTTIKYTTHENIKVSINIYNTVGQLVKRLVDKKHAPGNHSVTWNATNNYNNKVANGIYYIMIKTGNTTEVSKMILSR